MTFINPTAPEICRLLASLRLPLTHEKTTQKMLEPPLRACFPEADIEREPVLSPGERPDFRIGRIYVELKLKKGATAMQIYRQLVRYAEHEAVDQIILATGRAMGLPEEIGGKPAFYVSLGRAWL